MDDTYSGNSIIASAEYFTGGKGGQYSGKHMLPLDGIYDSPVEWVHAILPISSWTTKDSPYHIAIHGVDDKGNWGNYCEFDIVISPSGTPRPTQIPLVSSMIAILILVIFSGLLYIHGSVKVLT